MLQVGFSKSKDLDNTIPFIVLKSVLDQFIDELQKNLTTYYIEKANSTMQIAGSFIYEFLELVLSYKNLFKSHIQRMEQALMKVPESMKEIILRVSQFRETFQKKWMMKQKKRESIQGYIFDVHMANIIIIFRNYKVDVAKETWEFLEKFQKLFEGMDIKINSEDNKLLRLIKQFQDTKIEDEEM